MLELRHGFSPPSLSLNGLETRCFRRTQGAAVGEAPPGVVPLDTGARFRGAALSLADAISAAVIPKTVAQGLNRTKIRDTAMANG
jgi:hypothetical protein